MASYRVTLKAQDMPSLQFDPQTNNVIGGGHEAIDAIIRQVRPTARETVGDALGRGPQGEITQKSRRISGELSTGISGQPRGKAHDSIQRTLQRWADGTRTPTAKTVEKYQTAYQANIGSRNAQLDKLLDIITGKVQPAKLPKGDITITPFGKIEAYPSNPENRDPRSVNIQIKSRDALVQQQAFMDPIATWLAEFSRGGARELQTIETLTVTFVEK